MKIHANAKLGPKGRLVMCRRVVEEDWSLMEAAEAAGVSERTAAKWVARYRTEGEAGLSDRSSAPKSIANRTDERRIEAIASLRRLRMTGAEIAFCLGMALSTVSGILAAIGLGKLSRLEPPEPPNRYERKRPGELVHIDVKKLGRIGRRGPGHRVTGSRGKGRRSRGAGWEASTSASTTPPASPTSRCSQTRRRAAASPSCAAPSPSTAPTESGSSG